MSTDNQLNLSDNNPQAQLEMADNDRQTSKCSNQLDMPDNDSRQTIDFSNQLDMPDHDLEVVKCNNSDENVKVEVNGADVGEIVSDCELNLATKDNDLNDGNKPNTEIQHNDNNLNFERHNEVLRNEERRNQNDNQLEINVPAFYGAFYTLLSNSFF